MIRITQHVKKAYVKTHKDSYFEKERHVETYKITTYWFLFIPVFIHSKII